MTHKDEIHILQFGTGNFLRAFFEPMVQDLNSRNNKLNICIIQSTSGKTLEKLKAQNFQYHVLEAGIKNGVKVEKIEKIDCVKTGLNLPNDIVPFLNFAKNPQVKWIISNVTEAGMEWKNECPIEQFAESFPGRITQWLYQRFKFLPEQETILLPCELLTGNGSILKNFVIQHAQNWNIEEEFFSWLDQKVWFFNSLVDRIVPGFPGHLNLREKEIDPLLVQTEPYSFWAIEGSPEQRHLLPFMESSAEVILQEDISEFALRKIRILNGCHTFLASRGGVLGQETVGDCMNDPATVENLEELVENEIIPFLPLDKQSLQTYKNQVFDRFRNPFVKHRLEDIRLNSVAKFKSRLLPLVPAYQAEHTGNYPKQITEGLLYLIIFYLDSPQKIKDTQEILDFFAAIPTELAKKKKVEFVVKNLFGLEWNESLNAIYDSIQQKEQSLTDH